MLPEKFLKTSIITNTPEKHFPFQFIIFFVFLVNFALQKLPLAYLQ